LLRAVLSSEALGRDQDREVNERSQEFGRERHLLFVFDFCDDVLVGPAIEMREHRQQLVRQV